MFSSFIAITVWFMRNESILKNSYRHLPFCTYIITVTNTAKVNKYARKGSVVVKKFIAHFRTIKLLFLFKIYNCEIYNVFGV